MPTYEYECTKCGHKFELFQSMTDPPAKRCPECRCKVRRVLGVGAGIIFKGKGFYQTDYRSASYQEKAKQDASSVSSSKASDDKPSGSADKSKPAKAKKTD